jgi:hypothetical protein
MPLNSSSSKNTDINGWIEIKGNPISKVGVFPYSGAQISPELDPDTIYYVYRPEEELSHPDCIESFKLIPWTDEHAMLGSDDEGLLPAEQKGIEGVIGEDVYFEDGYLKGNIKIFSEKLAELINSGKKELSIGYRCLYDVKSGVYNGQNYDAIQKNIRGNHLALVAEGRSGPDVAVLDSFKFTFDTAELNKMIQKDNNDIVKDEDMQNNETKDEGLTLESLAGQVKALAEAVAKLTSAEKQEIKGDEEPVLDNEENKGDMSKPQDEELETPKKETMDAKLSQLNNEIINLKKHGTKVLLAEISKRDQLAAKLSQHIGTFDHAEKTLDEVAEYGVKKLGLPAEKGQEQAVLSGFFAAEQLHGARAAMDSSRTYVANSQIDAYINGSN